MTVPLLLVTSSSPIGEPLITPGEAASLLGTWTSVMEGPSGPVNIRITISVHERNVVAIVSSDLMSDGNAQKIRYEVPSPDLQRRDGA
jgi:hypothetical protein